jgi:outer membrane protein OmpA-like peptidoglycan-associated protein
LTQKLLLAFNEHYKEGSISYANGKLTVDGIVGSDVDRNTISTLLANSTIDSQNNTRVLIPGPTAEEIAVIQEEADAEKARIEAEEKARLEAEIAAKVAEDAKINSEEEARLLALAKREAQEKARAKAKLEKEAEAEALEAQIKVIIDSEHINFEVNKDILTTHSIRTIEQISDILKKHPSINVEISGHTDNTGNADYNLVLSQKRVNSVKEKLMELQIDRNRLTAVGYGANQPLVSNDTKENRHINRRVEFKVIGE